MEEEMEVFIHGNTSKNIPGCVQNGISEATARKIYSDMLDFAKYAFNKSHAACYAYVTMQTAWLKYYYPVEFMAALLTSVIDAPAKVSGYIITARSMGIKFLPPDINEGEAGFSPAGEDSIRYGLSAIKSIGLQVIEEIVGERERNGKFADMYDFLYRIPSKVVNKRAVESFIKAGALDSLGGTRKQMMGVYETMMDDIAAEKKSNFEGQLSFFDIGAPLETSVSRVNLPNVGEFSNEEKLKYEKEVLGVFVSGHPLKEYEAFWRKNITAYSTEFILDPETSMISLEEGKKVTVGGIIEEVQTKYTKKGDTMAILLLEDLFGTVECLVWPRQYEKYAEHLVKEEKVFITGRVKADDEKDGQVVLDSLKVFGEVGHKLFIQFANKAGYSEAEERLFGVLEKSEGRDAVIIYLKEEKQKRELKFKVSAEGELMKTLEALYGPDNVKKV